MFISRFLSQNQDKIILIIGAILIAAIGFAAGRLTAVRPQSEPIVIEEPEQSLQYVQEEGSVLGEKEDGQEKENMEIKEIRENKKTSEEPKEKQYVGSKSGKKYHYPDCRYGKKINEENKIWFKSAKEAQEAGYEPCKVCKPPSSD